MSTGRGPCSRAVSTGREQGCPTTLPHYTQIVWSDGLGLPQPRGPAVTSRLWKPSSQLYTQGQAFALTDKFALSRSSISQTRGNSLKLNKRHLASTRDAALFHNICKKLISLKHCVRSEITRLKLQKSFCDLEHGASL